MRTDLNLLQTFVTIMQERSVTKAAERLFVGQPAVSASLGKLRDHFGDPLFIRKSRGLVPTPRASELYGEILEPLQRLQALTQQREQFDPLNYVGTIKIGLSEELEYLKLPTLAAELSVQAPQMHILSRPINFFTAFDLLKNADIDMAVTSNMPSHPDWVAKKSLDSFPFKVLYDGASRRNFNNLSTYLKAKHVHKSYGGQARDVVDRTLAHAGHTRHIAVTVNHFASVPMLVSGAKLIATLPSHVADSFAGQYDLKSCPAPFDIPDYSLALYWHRRIDSNHADVWFRRKLEQLLEGGL